MVEASGFVKKSSWRWNRLRAMSLVEIASRLLLAWRHHRWRRRNAWHAPRARVVRADQWSFRLRPEEARDDVALLLEEADRISSGAFSLLNCSFTQTAIDWHFDPQLGVRAPVTFSPDIDYRDTTVAGNVKNIWELNRHQHLTVLAAAYSITKDVRYADAVASQIVSWLRANPTLQGVNWHSPLELAIRLISWLWIERLLRDSPAHERLFGDDGAIWPSVYWHQWLIRTCLSHGSSSNNHLIGELTGLFVTSTAWPYFEESEAWQRTARRGLEAEVARQTFPSGLNREQAFSYHLFVLELFVVAALEGERAGAPFSAELKGCGAAHDRGDPPAHGRWRQPAALWRCGRWAWDSARSVAVVANRLPLSRRATLACRDCASPASGLGAAGCGSALAWA